MAVSLLCTLTAQPGNAICADCCNEMRGRGFDVDNGCPIVCTGGLVEGTCDEGCSQASANGVYAKNGKTWYCNVDIDGGGWHLAYTINPSDGNRMGWGSLYWTQTTDSHPITDAVLGHDFVSADGANMVRRLLLEALTRNSTATELHHRVFFLVVLRFHTRHTTARAPPPNVMLLCYAHFTATARVFARRT